MNRPTWKVAALLFGSGMCALIYQTTWLRQFRLIFGASTLATAAVLAIFMAGLGLGSALLGKRADRSEKPLDLYGLLELAIAISAAASIPLLMLVEKIYIATGGSVTLGPTLATVVRLLLSLLVLGIPTFLMGGTLPAAARAVSSREDAGRRRLALLYGLNTLGAVTGALVSTFFLLERFGNRLTLIVAVLVNLIVAVIARSSSRTIDTAHETESGERTIETAALPPRLVYVAAAVVGFSFLLMELVWYRMLSPLLGGTTFMFGLILAIALLGIGLGGAAWSLLGGRATAGGFALTCSLEALAMIVPFALGDRLAVMASLLRPLGVLGFGGEVLMWTAITMVVVFPAAFISGIQFPILIALLGRGREDIGRQVGATYAWNTAGAIAGSLAGGFGLMPLLSAPGCWRLVSLLLVLVAVAALVHTMRARQFASAIACTIAIAGSIAATFALGPTALWRHSGIGADRAPQPSSRNELLDWTNAMRRALVWDADGRESSVALVASEDYAMIVNGKSDGAARGDAGTQVMSAMIGAIAHGNVQSSLVIGLGTGSTAGWLGAIPQMKVVDAVELEPLSIDIARACAPVNHDVLANPKVKIRVADAREVLLATPSRYDLIFSEPSNPYRAGIASLFTKEFYEASAARLNERGMFLQWVQTYGIDAQTMETIYATMSSVFPHVETWWTSPGDIVLVASKTPLTWDAAAVRERLQREPYRSAAHYAWRAETAEAFFAHFIAPSSVTRAIAADATDINTDDRTPIEFGFARAMRNSSFRVSELYALARKHAAEQPNVRGAIDWRAVAENRHSEPFLAGAGSRSRFAYLAADLKLSEAVKEWRGAPFATLNSREGALLALALADAGDPSAELYAEALAVLQPIEADAIVARLRFRQSRLRESAALLERAFVAYRGDAWPLQAVMSSAITTTTMIVEKDRTFARPLAAALSKPFAAGQWEESRKRAYVTAARAADGCGPITMEALRALEPHPPWQGVALQARAECYAKAGMSELAASAREDLDRYFEAQPTSLK
jgi:spermidine synthase